MAINWSRRSLEKCARTVCLVLICILLVPLSAFAVSLDEAKGKGLVGEEPTGYLGAVVSSADVNSLVQDINAKRRDKYQQIAEQNRTPVAAVEALAGKKAIENTPPGQFVKSPGGGWTKK